MHRHPPKPTSTGFERLPAWHAFCAAMVVAGLVPPDPATADSPAGRAPVIYSSDLLHPYDDPDDHYDLATLFALPELDVRAIILDLGERQRQRSGRVPLEQMFDISGRRVPFAAGLAAPLQTPDDRASDRPPDEQRGVELLLDTLRSSSSPVTIITAGSLRDLAVAFNREPQLLKSKTARVYVNAGAAEGDSEWNVGLDVHAYVAIMRSGLPLYWCPCMPMQPHPHSTWWKFRQAEILDALPAPLLNYFVYALQQVSAEDIDPRRALAMDLRPWRRLPGSMDRNMWCTASLMHAAGRRVWRAGDACTCPPVPPPGAGEAEVFTFTPARVEIDASGRTRVVEGNQPPNMHLFTVRDQAAYAPAMTACLRELLAGLATASAAAP